MCKVEKRTFGIELEGYTDENIRGNYVKGWDLVSDGSLNDGREDCDYCNGSGEGTHECSDCYGSGHEECSDCCGGGEVPCGHCDCSGYVTDDEGEEVYCDDCDGSGYIECNECDGRGRVDCEGCDGDGEIEGECYECDGRGYFGDEDEGCGVECVSNILTEGDTDSIDTIFDYIERYDWTVNDDCGTHVHVGGKDLNAQELSRLAILMNIVEPMIYGTLPSDRIDGTFAKMTQFHLIDFLIDKGDDITLQELADSYYGYRVRLDGSFQKYDGARYYGLNLHSWFYRKTLEFRYFEGCNDREQANAWIDLCIKLVDFAKYTSFEQLIVIGQDFHALDDLSLKLGKLETLLGLESNFRAYSNYSYDKSMRNLAHQLRPATQVSRAV